MPLAVARVPALSTASCSLSFSGAFLFLFANLFIFDPRSFQGAPPKYGSSPCLAVLRDCRSLLAQQAVKRGRRRNHHESPAMLHIVFNQKEQMQGHRTETKKDICRVQGGTENGPFPRDKLHTKRFPFPFCTTWLPSQATKSSP